MKTIAYTIKTLAPVAFAEKNSDSTLLSTKDYVPGAAVRGLMAHTIISENNLKEAYKNDDFYDVILAGKVRFLPAYPVGASNKKGKKSFVAPLSIMKHKTKSVGADLAVDIEKRSIAGFKKVKGFLIKDEDNLNSVDVKLQAQIHMARNAVKERISGHSDEGNIFNYEYIEPGQYFNGQILVDEDVLPVVEKYLSILNNQSVYMGRSRRAQYGKCEFTSEVVEPKENAATIGDKIFLYALTDYIPNKEWQRVNTVVEELIIALEGKLKANGSNAKLEAKNIDLWSAKTEINGYVGVWKARQERKYALAAGTIFSIPVENLTQNDLNDLTTILEQGLGDRTEEGYGQFRVWQPMSSPKISKLEDKIEEVHLNKTVKKQARQVVRKRILREIAVLAKEYAQAKNIKNHILARIESLMDSSLSRDEIINKVKNEFKDKATSSLKKAYLNEKYSVYEYLSDKKIPQIYEAEDLLYKLGLSGKNKELFVRDLGKDIIDVSDDEVFKTFWLWYARHQRKHNRNAVKEGK